MKSKKLYSPIVASQRFGLGARPEEIDQIGSDARDWLFQQLRKNPYPKQFNELPSSSELIKKAAAERQKSRKSKGPGAQGRSEKDRDLMRDRRRRIREAFRDEMLLRMQVATTTNNSFVERLVRFWSNHFTVSARKQHVMPLAGSFEREAIRPHINGRFEDMLLAASSHPAMLLYLDNHRSIGPNSRVGNRRNKGLNENLAREILELHTLGVNGGYSQKDVEALANILTGWTVPVGPLANRNRRSIDSGFVFVEQMHQPGAKNLLGRRYREAGVSEGKEALQRLARHPSTAKHIAFKLAKHFISDKPPQAAVNYLAKVYQTYGGDLERVSRALIELDDCWENFQSKVKSPEELLISCLRVASPDIQPRFYRRAFEALGQLPFHAPSPAGWPDTAEEWIGPDAMIARLELVRILAYRMPRSLDARVLAAKSYGSFLTATTSQQLLRAPSAKMALALFFASSEFQRR